MPLLACCDIEGIAEHNAVRRNDNDRLRRIFGDHL